MSEKRARFFPGVAILVAILVACCGLPAEAPVRDPCAGVKVIPYREGPPALKTARLEEALRVLAALAGTWQGRLSCDADHGGEMAIELTFDPPPPEQIGLFEPADRTGDATTC